MQPNSGGHLESGPLYVQSSYVRLSPFGTYRHRDLYAVIAAFNWCNAFVRYGTALAAKDRVGLRNRLRCIHGHTPATTGNGNGIRPFGGTPRGVITYQRTLKTAPGSDASLLPRSMRRVASVSLG